jgi:transcriptional regulator with XRE-family HTH domain
MKQSDLADRLKLHQTSISKMEKGMIPIATQVLSMIQGQVEMTEGQRAMFLRRRYKRTLADAAAATGIHAHRISDMERGIITPVATQYTSWIERSKSNSK